MNIICFCDWKIDLGFFLLCHKLKLGFIQLGKILDYWHFFSLSAACEKESFGVGDGRIADSQLTASSSNKTARYGRLNSNVSWCATDDDRNPYLQIDLGVKCILCAVSTQGDARGNFWVVTYHLQSSDDGVVWKNYSINGVYKVTEDQVILHFCLQKALSEQLQY